MSESSSLYTDTTGNSGGTSSDISGTNVPLILMSAYEEEQKAKKNGHCLPKLPSHRYQYTTWHELRYTQVKGDQLKAPRVREGPAEKEITFYTVKDEQERHLHHALKGKERKDYRNTTENWENAEFCNLSYQDLAHEYQRDNFIRILKRLHKVVELNLIDNNLYDIHSVSLPCCTHLNMTRNYIGSFKKLAKMPKIKVLNLALNDISNFEGLEYFKKTPLESLNLKGNPVEFTECYRARVFHTLPNLKILDNIPKLDTDNNYEPEYKDENSTCCIC